MGMWQKSMGRHLRIDEVQSICAVCGKHLKRITPKHLATHDMSVAYYKDHYGELTFAAQVRKQIIDLFNPNRYRWAQQMGDGSYRELQYQKTYTKESGETYTMNYFLHDSLLNSHLTGKNTISIFPKRRNNASFLIFDVDAHGQSRDLTLKLVDALYECGMNREDIHVSFSGKKGYHVEIFWSEPVDVKRLERFGTYVKTMVGVINDSIELRPRTIGGNGIKLPIGYHRKSGNFCGYVDNETLEPVANPYHYFLAIQSIDPAFLDLVDYDSQPTISLVINNERLVPTRAEAVGSAERTFEHGLMDVGTRHFAMFKIAIWMRDEKGYDQNTAEAELLKWIQTQHSRGMLHDTVRDAERDLQAVLKGVFGQGKYRLGATTRQITISSVDIDAVFSVKQKSARLLYFAMILHGKMYCKNAFGTFTASQEQLIRITKMSHHTIRSAREFLEARGFIRIIEMGKPAGLNAKQRKATEYNVPHLAGVSRQPTTDSIEITVEDDMDCKTLLADVCSLLGMAA